MLLNAAGNSETSSAQGGVVCGGQNFIVANSLSAIQHRQLFCAEVSELNGNGTACLSSPDWWHRANLIVLERSAQAESILMIPRQDPEKCFELRAKETELVKI